MILILILQVVHKYIFLNIEILESTQLFHSPHSIPCPFPFSPFLRFSYGSFQTLKNEYIYVYLYMLMRLVTQSYLILCDPEDCSLPGSSVHGDSPAKNTGVGCHGLLQGIFLTKGWNPGLPHCRRILYHLSHQGSPKGNSPNMIKAIYETHSEYHTQ